MGGSDLRDPSTLRRFALFGELSPRDCDELAVCVRSQVYSAGTVIFFEDAAVNALFLVESGCVKLIKLLPDGREAILGFEEPGGFFGETAAIAGEPALATAISVEKSHLLLLPGKALERLSSRVGVERRLLQRLSRRCREAYLQLEIVTHHNAEARIRSALYQLCRSQGLRLSRGSRSTSALPIAIWLNLRACRGSQRLVPSASSRAAT